MNKNILCFLFVSIAAFLQAQVNTFDIFLDYVPGHNSSLLHGIEQTRDNGYILSRAPLDTVTNDFFNDIIKLDKTGDISWSKKFKTGKWDTNKITKRVGHPIVLTSDGNYLLGTSIYDSLMLPHPCLVKLNVNGDLIWSKKYLNNGYGIIYNLIETTDKKIIVCGSATDTTDNKTYAMAFQTEADGTYIWGNKSVITDSTDGVFNSVTEVPGEGYAFAGFSKKSSLLVKTNLNGTVVWSKHLSNNFKGSYDYVNTIIHTSDNSLLVTGGSLHENKYYNQLFFSKLNTNGEEIWTKVMNLTGMVNDCYGAEVKEKDNTYYFTAYIMNPIPCTALGALSEKGDVKWCKQYHNTFLTFNY